MKKWNGSTKVSNPTYDWRYRLRAWRHTLFSSNFLDQFEAVSHVFVSIWSLGAREWTASPPPGQDGFDTRRLVDHVFFHKLYNMGTRFRDHLQEY